MTPQKLTLAGEVEAAALRISDSVILSPLQICERLTTATGSTVYLKREDLQMVRSYKIRGAFNFMLQLDADERTRGVVCASAGNHAQGFARACRELASRAPSSYRRRRRSRRSNASVTSAGSR